VVCVGEPSGDVHPLAAFDTDIVDWVVIIRFVASVPTVAPDIDVSGPMMSDRCSPCADC
jgi:hypothetical protein